VPNYGVWFIVVLAAVAVASQPTSPRQEPLRYTDGDAFDVYSALMPSPIGVKSVLVVNTTIKPEGCPVSEADMPDADFREAVKDFHRENDEARILAGEFRSPVKADFVDRRELDSYFRRGADKGWKKFYRAHPKASGTVAFSAVGFNDKRTAAVVYSAIVSCSECGVGALHFLKRGADGWTEIKPEFASCWIS
jgi:hypothetical protein